MTSPPPDSDPVQGFREPRPPYYTLPPAKDLPPPAASASPVPGIPPPGSVTAYRKTKSADLVVTIVLLVIASGLAGFGSLLQGASIGLSVGCAGSNRDDCVAFVDSLMVSAFVLPWLIIGVTSAVAIRRLVTRKVAFWIPLVGLGLLGGAFAAIAAVFGVGWEAFNA